MTRMNAQKRQTAMEATLNKLSSAYQIFENENGAAYQDLRIAFIDSWEPANAAELALVDQITFNYWRMLRGRRYEAAIYAAQVRNMKEFNKLPADSRPDDDVFYVVGMAVEDNERMERSLDRFERRTESAYYRAMDRLRSIQRERKRDDANREKRIKAEEKEIAETLFYAHPDTIATPSNEPPAPPVETGSFGKVTAIRSQFQQLATSQPLHHREPAKLTDKSTK